jgi:hypothetical protein
MDLLTIYTHHLELQVITALSLISTVHISLHAKSSSVYSVFNGRLLVTDVNNEDYSASRAQVLSFKIPVQNCLSITNSTELTTPELECRFSTELSQFGLGSSLYSLVWTQQKTPPSTVFLLLFWAVA